MTRICPGNAIGQQKHTWNAQAASWRQTATLFSAAAGRGIIVGTSQDITKKRFSPALSLQQKSKVITSH